MQARQILALGQKGANKFLERYGGQLVCARIRYTELQRRVKQAGGKRKAIKWMKFRSIGVIR
jgi:hypothetical protein